MYVCIHVCKTIYTRRIKNKELLKRRSFKRTSKFSAVLGTVGGWVHSRCGNYSGVWCFCLFVGFYIHVVRDFQTDIWFSYSIADDLAGDRRWGASGPQGWGASGLPSIMTGPSMSDPCPAVVRVCSDMGTANSTGLRFMPSDL